MIEATVIFSIKEYYFFIIYHTDGISEFNDFLLFLKNIQKCVF